LECGRLLLTVERGGRGDQEYIRDASILSHNIYNAPQKGQAGCRAFGKVPGIRESIRRREACYPLSSVKNLKKRRRSDCVHAAEAAP